MAIAKDSIGKTFSRLTVLRFDATRNYRIFFLCRCECGKESVVDYQNLRSGHTKSCGCLSQEVLHCSRKHGDKHRGRKASEYNSWAGMMQRCRNPRNRKYPNYGGRGIAVCDRWMEYSCFLADMGRRPSPQHSIDRIDNSGNYEPGNCRWATAREQARNTRTNRLITVNEKTRSLAEWAELLGCTEGAISSRIDRGWSVEDSVLTPLRERSNVRQENHQHP